MCFEKGCRLEPNQRAVVEHLLHLLLDVFSLCNWSLEKLTEVTACWDSRPMTMMSFSEERRVFVFLCWKHLSMCAVALCGTRMAAAAMMTVCYLALQLRTGETLLELKLK